MNQLELNEILLLSLHSEYNWLLTSILDLLRTILPGKSDAF